MVKSVDTVLSTDPTGNVTADFSGHVSAKGLDLAANAGAGIWGNENTISWHRDTVTGAKVAEVSALQSDGAGIVRSGFTARLDQNTANVFMGGLPVTQSATAFPIRYGITGAINFTWAGGTSIADFQFTHSLGVQPVACMTTAGGLFIVIILTMTTSIVGFRAQTPTGTAPPAGTISAIHFLIYA